MPKIEEINKFCKSCLNQAKLYQEKIGLINLGFYIKNNQNKVLVKNFYWYLIVDFQE